MPAFAKVRPGDPVVLRASDWNAILDSARARNRGEDLPSRQAAPRSFDPTVIQVRNGTGGDLLRGRAVALGDPVIDAADDADEFFQRLALEGESLAAEHFGGPWGVLREPIADGEFGLAIVGGLAHAKLKINSASHGWADVKDGTFQTDWYGTARVLWKEDGTGEDKLALLQLAASEIQWQWVKLDADLIPGGSAAASLWIDETGGMTDSGDGLTVYAPPLLTTETISAPAWCKIEWKHHSRRWYVTAYECV